VSVPAIAISDIYKAYPGVQALGGVSLEIEEGEFFGLLGPNGAGKSTLINILAGLVKSDLGSVSVQGKDTVSDFRFTRRSLGIVPQEIVYDPFFTVEEVLRIQGGYFGIRENSAWIEELLAALGLADKRGANLRSLSGGMKRRLLIAQALVHKPPIVILDEPTAGVDVEQRHALWAFIERLNRDGHTILLTTHYLEEAERLCDRIAIIDRGEVRALDTKENLIARSHAKALTLTAREKIGSIPKELEAQVMSREATSLTIELDADGMGIREICDLLHVKGIEIIDIESFQPRLEDIFLELTRRDEGKESSASREKRAVR